MAEKPENLADAAHDLAQRGFSIFPLAPCGKKPVTSHGFKDATTDTQQISEWWAQNPNYNIGLRTGAKFFVVDVDNVEVFDRLVVENGTLPECPVILTGRGRHYYFACPPGMQIKGRTGIAGCFDIKAEGGYIVAPPSIHPSGARYQVKVASEGPLPTPPGWLIDLIVPVTRKQSNTAMVMEAQAIAQAVSKYGESAINDACEKIASASAGERNETLNREAFSIGQLIAGGEVKHENAVTLMRSAALSSGLKEPEVEKTLHSAVSSGMAHPRCRPENTRKNNLTFGYECSESLEGIVTIPEIEPLADYPLDGLGPLLGDAARAIAERSQAPKAIAAQSVLSVAASVCQEKSNLKHLGSEVPLSLFCLTVAESGDRKSSCDRVALKPITEWHQEIQKVYRERLQEYSDELEVYESLKKKAISKIKDQSELASALKQIKMPKKPLSPDIICQEPTLEGLQKAFHEGRPSMGMFNDEGGQFFGGYAMNKENATKTIAGLSKFWDGAPIVRTRGGLGETFTLYNRRLSIHLQTQPIVAKGTLSDPLLQEQGILARFLVAEVRSLAGTRLLDPGILVSGESEDPAIKKFQLRVKGLLEQPLKVDECGGLELDTIEFNTAAFEIWGQFYNEVERMLAPGRDLEQIKPFAAKIAENVARIAGVISVFNGWEKIDETCIRGSIVLGQFYLRQSLRIAQIGAANKHQKWLTDVIDWISQQGGEVDVDTIQRLSPRTLGLRKSVRQVRQSFEVLVKNGILTVAAVNRKNNPKIYALSPAVRKE
nr:DUF3987 domain-containing protein [Microbulbifer guangxiensis]